MARPRARRRAPRGLVVGLLLAFAAFALGYWAIGLRREPEPVQPPRPAPAARPAPRAEPVPPEPRAVEPAPPPAVSAGGRLALVVDDLGRSLAEIDRLERLGVPLSYAVLPFEPRTREVVERLRAAGAEILCHLPLEGREGADPGPGAIREDDPLRRIERRTRAAIDAVPGATGLNNHMGSKVTADRQAMSAVIEVVAERGLFFLDSRTTADSVAYEVARQAGVPTARRAVFLDGEREPATIRAEFERLLAEARERGAAIAIAHPHAVTFDALEEMVPAALAAGFEFVPVSFLLERDEGLPE